MGNKSSKNKNKNRNINKSKSIHTKDNISSGKGNKKENIEEIKNISKSFDGSKDIKTTKNDFEIKMENNNENVSKNKKSIYIDFNGTTQTIKYYGKFDIESIKKFVKSRFSIEESIEQIFFKDEDDDILVLNKNTPDNIKVYLFILKDLIPKNPSTALKISEIKNEKSLLKFHWVLENEERNARFKDCIVDKYIYKNINDSESHPQARSSVTFTKGIHFCVIRVGSFQDYECLRVVDDYSPCIKESWNFKHNTIIGFSFNFHSYTYSLKDIWTLDIGILIDMEKKYVLFMIMKGKN